MNAARRITSPRRAMAQPGPAPRALPHPIPVASDPTGNQAVRNADRNRRRRDELLADIPAKFRPAHA